MDNFDLRKYLVENKMTENSRGNRRRHFCNLNEEVKYDKNKPEDVWAPYNNTIIASGKGFNPDEIIAGLKKAQDEKITWFDLDVTPSENGVAVVELKGDVDYARQAEKVVDALKNGDCADETIGWYMCRGQYRPGIYPMLTPEGVEKYHELKEKLSRDIDRFYAGSNWWGD